jgi:hypothetical protein
MARDPFFDPSEAAEPSTVAPSEAALATPDGATEGEASTLPKPVDESPRRWSLHKLNPLPPGSLTRGDRGGTHDAQRAGDEIDLTDELGELKVVGPPPARERGTLDHVFADMRSKAEGDPDYSAQHMVLAHYLEIGMVQEAMTSLQNAARSPRQRFEAATALGGSTIVRRYEPGHRMARTGRRSAGANRGRGRALFMRPRRSAGWLR